MNTSPTITKLVPALLEAQKKIEVVTKDATANAGSFKYNYATLSIVIESIKIALNDSGITFMQPVCGDKVCTLLIHSSGEWIQDEGVNIICAKPNDPQAQGSALSYGRRYGLMSMLCLSAEDDDGAKAMPSPQPAKQTISKSPDDKDNEFKGRKCKDCGGGIAISKGGKPYCQNKCWLPEGKHFRDKYTPEPVEDIIIPEDTNSEEMPF